MRGVSDQTAQPAWARAQAANHDTTGGGALLGESRAQGTAAASTGRRRQGTKIQAKGGWPLLLWWAQKQATGLAALLVHTRLR